jgi:hypothetical protein
VQQFRTGTGGQNALPVVGPVVITELMYHPVSGPPNKLSENPNEEYVELYNASAAAVSLYDPAHATNTWRLAGGVDYAFPAGTTLMAGEAVLVVDFDPVLDTAKTTAFRLRYGLSGAVRLFGPYDGQLSNRGETVELLQPDTPQAPPHPDAGYVPYVRVDYVRYGTSGSWSVEADGNGSSLQRRRPLAYGNEPLNWKAALPTPGTVLIDAADLDTDNDGMPDVWEFAHALNYLDPADANLDPDHDGLTNLQEYRAGTDPQDAASSLTLEITTTSEDDCFRFYAQSGRSYTIQSSDAIGSSMWLRFVDVPGQTTTGWVEVCVPRTELSAQKFFRLVTRAQFQE